MPVLPALVAVVLAADSLPAPDSTARAGRPPAAADSVAASTQRVVKVLEEFVVHGSLLHDPRSSQSVQQLTRESLRRLPIDDLAGAVALRAGVVARGEILHVRGGRAGDLRTTLQGIALEEPFRRRPMEVPLLALEQAELVSGGLDAAYGGGVAGVLVLQPAAPPSRPAGEILWQTDGGLDTRYDRVAGRFGLPLPGDVAAVVTAEARLDDSYLPALRTQGRRDLLGGSFGWRANNRLLGHLRLEHTAGSRLAVDVLASRIVDQPWNPMWTIDGYTAPDGDPESFGVGPMYSPDPLPGFSRYRAADHLAMTDERRMATVLSWTRTHGDQRTRAALGWTGLGSVTSVGGQNDERYLEPGHDPVWGLPENQNSDYFLVYQGDEPFFQHRTAHATTLRADHSITTANGNAFEVGLGGTYEFVRLREFDVSVRMVGIDSLRSFQTWAPGAFGYAQGRWVFQGLVLNAGLRGEWFTAGPQAERQSFGQPAEGILSFSPRLGVAYPISVRDVFSLAYVRVQQDPGRDFLYDSRRRVGGRQPIGSVDLEPSTMISYQAAVKHLFEGPWAVQAAFFYRDLWGQIGTRYEPDEDGAIMPHYSDEDDGSATGFELSLLRAADAGGWFQIHYTYMQAHGIESLEEGTPYGVRLGERPPAFGDHPLDWDQRHSLAVAAQVRRAGRWGSWAAALSSAIGSGLPWTPRPRRQLETDQSQTNSRRLEWQEATSLSATWWPRWLRDRVTLGLEIHNPFDRHAETSTSVDGYPHPAINTVFDDYGAYRTETGLAGGAWWDDANGDGFPGWIAVHDPRLFQAPRTVRFTLAASF